MTKDTVRTEVRALAGAISRRDDVSIAEPAQRLEQDLEYDSLGKMELAVALERQFRLTAVHEEDVMGLDTVHDIEELVIRVLERQSARAPAQVKPA
jgi:acyl carrier protein